jgi:hypothetical protein
MIMIMDVLIPLNPQSLGGMQEGAGAGAQAVPFRGENS